MVRRDPERPLPLRPKLSPFQCARIMQSPPSPFIIGSVTLTIAAMAIAASAALPPAFRMSLPTAAASG